MRGHSSISMAARWKHRASRTAWIVSYVSGGAPYQEAYEIVAVKTGHEGLQALKENQVDVVLLDIAMPGMDGIETLGKILDVDNQMPVILNTAYSSYKDDFMTWSADAYVIKSHDLSELHQAIATVLEKRGIQPPPPPAEDEG